MGPMGELGALFNPGMRHELEERQAKAARREEEGNAKDGDLRIDLESGVAVINAPDQQNATDASGENVTSGENGSTNENASTAESGTAVDIGTTVDGGADDDKDPAGAGARIGVSGPAAAKDKSAAAGTAAVARPAQQPSDQPRPRGKRGVSAGR